MNLQIKEQEAQADRLLQNLSPAPNSPLAYQLRAKLDVLNMVAKYVENSYHDAKSVGTNQRINIGSTTPFASSFPDDPAYTSTISELSAAGLYTLYNIGSTAAPQRGSGAGMILGMVASIAATTFIGLAAFSFAGAFGSATLGTAAVGFTSRLAGSAVTNRGQIDHAFKDVTSKASLRSLGLEAISAGDE